MQQPDRQWSSIVSVVDPSQSPDEAALDLRLVAKLIDTLTLRPSDAVYAARSRQGPSSTAAPETHVTHAGPTAGFCHWAHLTVQSIVALSTQGHREGSDAAESTRGLFGLQRLRKGEKQSKGTPPA